MKILSYPALYSLQSRNTPDPCHRVMDELHMHPTLCRHAPRIFLVRTVPLFWGDVQSKGLSIAGTIIQRPSKFKTPRPYFGFCQDETRKNNTFHQGLCDRPPRKQRARRGRAPGGLPRSASQRVAPTPPIFANKSTNR